MIFTIKSRIIFIARLVSIILATFALSTNYAQKALMILKTDGSTTYVNASAVDKITFVTPLAIGDSYEGGIIFYLDASGQHGLVAQTSDQSTGLAWTTGSYVNMEATCDGVEEGKENTGRIVGRFGAGSYAARICYDLSSGGYTDWYLPSKYELNLMFTNLKQNGSGNFANVFYWSSTQSSTASLSWAQNFNTGAQTELDKTNTYYVRAVRAF